MYVKWSDLNSHQRQQAVMLRPKWHGSTFKDFSFWVKPDGNILTTSRFSDGLVAEIFINSAKDGLRADAELRMRDTRRKPTILCVDFDGVIHSYTSPWTDATTIPDPAVPGALKWLWKATECFDVQVYSSRSKVPKARIAMRDWMIRQAIAEFGEGHPMSEYVEEDEFNPIIYPITFAYEKPAAFLTIDDRAICFEGDWSDLEPTELLKFKPWNKRG